jgi:hypothetical protein
MGNVVVDELKAKAEASLIRPFGAPSPARGRREIRAARHCCLGCRFGFGLGLGLGYCSCFGFGFGYRSCFG